MFVGLVTVRAAKKTQLASSRLVQAGQDHQLSDSLAPTRRSKRAPVPPVWLV